MRSSKEIIEQVTKTVNEDTQFGAGIILVALAELEVLLDIRDIAEGIDRRLGAMQIKNGN